MEQNDGVLCIYLVLSNVHSLNMTECQLEQLFSISTYIHTYIHIYTYIHTYIPALIIILATLNDVTRVDTTF